MRERIIAVARERRALPDLPTNKQLAEEAGISERGVAWIMREELLRDKEVSRGTLEEAVEATIRGSNDPT